MIFATTALLWTLFLLPVQLVLIVLAPAAARRLPRVYHRGAARIVGHSVAVSGELRLDRPVLYVVNHASWLDIVVLGSMIDGGFVAKNEVAGWPGVGLLARLQGSLFVERKPSLVRRQTADIADYLAAGGRLILFPEGTSNDGNRVLPFRSGFFAVAERWAGEQALPVQPLSISYTRHRGLPLVRGLRPHVAWYGDMTLIPHLWSILCRGGRLDVLVDCHPAVTASDFTTRREMAEYCRARVIEGIERGRGKSGVSP